MVPFEKLAKTYGGLLGTQLPLVVVTSDTSDIALSELKCRQYLQLSNWALMNGLLISKDIAGRDYMVKSKNKSSHQLIGDCLQWWIRVFHG